MKKLILTTMSIAFVLMGIAQRPNVSKAAKNYSITIEKPCSIRISDGSTSPNIQFDNYETIVKEPRITKEFEEYTVMTTNYDLQSNSALGNRIATWSDGKASVVATWDHSGNTSFPDRGTGYNYYNGYNFGNEPTSRIESVKSGWPSIAAIGNGEILASHASGTNIYYRSTKGQGSWTLLKNFPNMTWPRIAVSGSNDQYVHLVAAYQEGNSSIGYTNYIYYSRSTNSGQTWSDPIELPLVDNSAYGTYRNQLSSDDYVIATNGNNVAIMLGSYTTEVFYIISHDNGQTWSKQVVAPFPVQGVHAIDFADYPNGMTDTISTSDNSHSIAIDNNGVVHVAFGLFHWRVTDGSHYTYYPAGYYGIVYWNSNYTNEQGGHNILLFGQSSIDANHPEWASNHLGWTLHPDRIDELAQIGGNQANLHLFGYVDENGNGQIDYENIVGATWRYRSLGLATMPGISVDESGRLAVIYSVWSETRINPQTDFSYRSAYVTYRDQYGQWYDDAINLSSGFVHEYDEVYPTFAAPRGYNGTFWMGYCADENQGLYLDISDTYPNSNGGVLTENYIYAVKVSPWGNIPNYTITTTANPTNGGTVSGGGTYAQGSTCYLHAYANSGFSFVKWTKNGTQVSTNPDYSFTVTGNASYVAHFEQNTTNFTITVSANPTNGGTVDGGGTYPYGTTVNLQANPNNGFTFSHWQDGNTQNPRQIMVTGNAEYVAHFEQDLPEYLITANADPANGGMVSGAGTYTLGSTCILTAMPNEGYIFENWTRDDFIVSDYPSYSFEVNRNAAYVAHFTQSDHQYTVIALADPINGGAVSGGGTYEQGATCPLTAVTNVGFEFVNWTVNGIPESMEANYSFTVTGNVVCVAHFQPIVNTYSIEASVEPTDGGTVIGAGLYEEGSVCTLIAMPNPTYSFVSWTENGAVVSTDDHYTFTVERNWNLVAVFSQGLFYTITASASDGGTISPEGNVLVEPGENKTFAMIPNSGGCVKKVIVDGVDIGSVESYTFRNVNGNHSIHAQFSGLGVDEDYVLGLKIYPNPANDEIHVESPNMKKVSIFNLMGVQIENKEINNDYTSINTNEYPQGTYILKVENKDGRIGYSRFVIVKK